MMRVPGWRMMTRMLMLAIVLCLAALLGGCTVPMAFFVRNNYPFAISIRDTYQIYGIVASGQRMRMPSGLSRYGPAHLEVCDPQGRVVRQIGISQNQIGRIYMSSKDDAAAVSLSVGPRSVSVAEVEDGDRSARNADGKAIVLTGLTVVMIGPVILWIVFYLRAQKAKWMKLRLDHTV